LNNLNSNEDKLYALASKYNDLIDSAKQKETSLKDTQKNLVTITKQRDQLQHDYSKQLLARNKLESLCRELQRHNKSIKVGPNQLEAFGGKKFYFCFFSSSPRKKMLRELKKKKKNAKRFQINFRFFTLKYFFYIPDSALLDY
jgi:hypothetical protein